MLTGKAVIITGAAGGLGYGIAESCVEEGANVLGVDIASPEAGSNLSSHPSVHFLQCDVTESASWPLIVSTCIQRFGSVHGLVNNAGANYVKSFVATTEEEWDKLHSLNLRAVFFLTQALVKARCTVGSDISTVAKDVSPISVVNISSVHERCSIAGAAPYAATKGALVALTRSLAVELAAYNPPVRVNCVSPGLVDTKIWADILATAPNVEECKRFWAKHIPLGRPMSSKEVGNTVAFVLSDKSIAMTGSNVLVDGGMTSQLIPP